MNRTLSLFILALLSGIPAFSQLVPNRYIVELDGDPAALYAVRRGHRAHRSDAVFQARAAEIHAQHDGLRQALQNNGAQILDTAHAALNAIMVRIPDADAGQLAALPGVKRVHQVRMYQTVLDRALPLMHVPDAWNQIGGMANAGLGVKIAIIDTGIDSSHPAFQDSSLTVPDGFPLVNQDSDRAFTNNKIIVARSYTDSGSTTAKDADGHGTGVAMVAAGATTTGPYGPITGVAPKAFLGSYKVFPNPNTGAPDDLIIKAIDDAVADGMDVLNLSLGSLGASRPADDTLVQTVENAVAAGKIVTIATGNGGPDPNTIASPGSAPDAISVGSMSNDRIFAGSLTYGGGAAVLAIPGSGPNSQTPISGPLQDIAQQDPTGLACSPLPAGSLSGSVALVLRGTCTFEQKINDVAAGGAIAALIYAAPNSPDPINMAAGAATLPASMVSNQVGTDIKQQLSGGPVNGTLVFTLGPIAVDPNRVSGFSSLGPNSDQGIKPDLIAVGDPIYTAQPVKNDGSANDGYVVESGTSFSSPMIAGAAALIKAARPGLSSAQYRSLLIDSASNFANSAAIQTTGAGFLNMQSALSSTLAAAPVSLSFGYGSATVNQTQSLTLTNLGTVSDSFAITVVPMSGSAYPSVTGAVQLDPGKSQTVAVQFAGTRLQAGAYQGYIQVQGSQSAVPARIPYWYAVASGTAAHITVLNSPTSGSANSRQTILFRITEASGVPLNERPTLTFSTGTGTVQAVGSIDSQIPGAYEAQVRLGVKAATYVIQISAGGLTQNVTIAGQ